MAVEQPRRADRSPQVEVRETVRRRRAAAGARRGAARRGQGAPQAPAVAGATAEPKKDEPVKFGPTGRVIELPLPRIEIRQARSARSLRAAASRRPRMPGQRRDTPRAGAIASAASSRARRRPQLGKKQKQTQITTPAAHKRVIKMDETIAVGEIAKQMGVKAHRRAQEAVGAWA